MPNETNGGVWALGGYLYQTIGLLGISAFVSNLSGNNAINPRDNLDILIRLIDVKQSIRIQPERFNQDTLIHTYGLEPNDDGVLIQFKYSAQVTPPPIGPQEAQQIVQTFDESVRSAHASGLNVTACILITNRRFAQGNGSGGEFWQNEKNRPARTYQLRDIASFSSQSFKDELCKFASRYGATETEIEAGISKLIGQVIIQSVEQSVNTDGFKETLIEAFTGYRHTMPVAASDLKDSCYRQLDDFARNIRIDAWHFSPVERDVFQTVFDLIQTRALIGLCGHGGYGKSVLLWQLLANRTNSICAIGQSLQLRSAWISYLVNHVYRNLPVQMAVEPIELAVERLCLANRDLPKPILLLGLDGLDEVTHPDQRSMVREIVSWFWEQDRRGGQSEAVLVTTFRSPNELRNLLDIPHDYQGRFPETLTLDQFSDKELVLALGRTFPDLVNNASLEPPERRAPQSMYSHAQNDYPDFIRTIDPSILASLHHPIVWRSLLNLEGPDRTLVLRGDRGALDLLALNLIHWFMDKLRRKRILDLNEERMLQLLTTIARGTTFGSSCPNSDWLIPTSEICGSSMAYSFLNEAELAGLIEHDSNTKWHWKHGFMYGLLKRQG